MRGHVHRARRSQIVGKIQLGLADLELRDRAGRYVLGCGSNGLIADVDAINFDARAASETSTERNGGIADLGRIEVRTVLDLHAWFELRQIQEVPAIHRKILDLLPSQNTLHARLFGIYFHGAGLYLDDLAFLANPQRGVDGWKCFQSALRQPR